MKKTNETMDPIALLEAQLQWEAQFGNDPKNFDSRQRLLEIKQEEQIAKRIKNIQLGILFAWLVMVFLGFLLWRM